MSEMKQQPRDLRFWQSQKFRWFVAISLAAHAAVGMIWGVPGYVRMRQEERAREQAIFTLQRQKEAAEKALAQAKAEALAQTRQEVAQSTRRTLDAVVKYLDAQQRDKLWEKVNRDLSAAQDAFAKALADRSHTEQDLRNIQADLSRQVVQIADAEMARMAQQAAIDDFVGSIQSDVVPELLRHYGDRVRDQVGNPLRQSADRFVNTSQQQAGNAANTARARLDQTRQKLDALRQQMDEAVRTSEAKALAQKIKQAQSSADACVKLAEGAANAAADADETMRGYCSTLATQLGTMRDRLTEAQTAAAVGKMADAGNTLTALVLEETKVRTTVQKGIDASWRSGEVVGDAARGAVGGARDQALSADVNAEFEKGFKSAAAPRLTAKLLERFAKLMDARGLKLPAGDEVKNRIDGLLCSKVGASGTFAAPGTSLLNDVVGARKPPSGDSGKKLVQGFSDTGGQIIAKGIAAVLASADADNWMVERAKMRDGSGLDEDARYRLETMATNAREGRTVGMLDDIGASQLTGLREGALARSALIDEMTVAAAHGALGAPSTDPTTQDSQDLTLAQMREELDAALKTDFMSLLGGRFGQGRADAMWADVQKATGRQVEDLAAQLLDPNVTDQDLEKNRLAFSASFYDAMQGALDQGASRDMGDALLKQIQGQLGQRVAGRYKDLVRDRMGGALQKEFGDAASRQRAAGDAQARAISLALDGTRDVINRATDLAGQSNERLNAGKDNADVAKGETGRLATLQAGVASASKDLASTTQPAAQGAVAPELAAADAAADSVAQDLQTAEDAAGKGDAKDAMKAIADARQAAGAFNQAADKARDQLNREADAAARAFAAGIRGSEADDGAEKGIKSQVQTAFAGQFDKTALPRLAGRVTEAYKQRLANAGLKADVDEAKLKEQVAGAFAQQVNGAAMGDAAIARLEEADFMRASNGATTRPAGEQAKAIQKATEHAVAAGAADVMGDGGAYEDAAQAVGGLAGPDAAFGEIKGKVGRLADALRGGAGGVLAGGDDEGDGNGAPSLRKLRNRWRGLFAGNGNGEGEGQGNGAAGGIHGGLPGNGAGRGTGRRGAGRGPLGGVPGLGYALAPRFDEAAYAKLIAETKQRKNVQGEAFDRQGAIGETSRATEDSQTLHPAMLITPATMPAAQTKNDQPYEPTFKSIAFLRVPYLNTPFAIDGDFAKWNDIPGFPLKPEKGDGTGLDGLHVADHITAKMAWDPTGLYVMVDVADADDNIKLAKTIPGFPDADVAEIWVDTLNTKERQRARGAGQQFWIWPFGMQDHPEFTGGESVKDLNTGFMMSSFSSDKLQRAAIKTPQGYRMEFHLPMERLRDAEMNAGRIVGFNMTVETGTKVHFYWSASKNVGTWGRPDTWGDVLLAGSDGKLEILEKLSADRSADEPDRVLKTFAIGQPLNIRVTDRDMNLRPDAKDKLSVTVKSAHGEQEIAILEETGPDTGVFEGSVRTGLYFGESVPGVLSVYEGEKVTITYVDQARANGARNAELQYSVQAGGVVTAVGIK